MEDTEEKYSDSIERPFIGWAGEYALKKKFKASWEHVGDINYTMNFVTWRGYIIEVITTSTPSPIHIFNQRENQFHRKNNSRIIVWTFFDEEVNTVEVIGFERLTQINEPKWDFHEKGDSITFQQKEPITINFDENGYHTTSSMLRPPEQLKDF